MNAALTAIFLILTTSSLLADVTKEDVRRLLDAHVSDATLISYIKKHGPVEPLTINDLTDLKKAGASDDVLQALLDGSRTSEAVVPEYGSDAAPATYYYYPYYVPYTIYPSVLALRPYSYYYSYPRTYHTYPYTYSTRRPYPTVYPNRYYYPPSYSRPRVAPPYRSSTPPPKVAPSRPTPRPSPPQQTPRGHGPYR